MDMLNELNQEYIGIGKAVDSKDPIPPTHMPRGHGATIQGGIYLRTIQTNKEERNQNYKYDTRTRIRQAITDKKNAYYNWKQNNRPNDPNNQWLQKKKVTTCNLRKRMPINTSKQQLERKSELINAKSNNSNLFFKLIRRQRGRFGMHIDELNVNGQKYNTERRNIGGFREHFANLSKQSDNSQFDQAYIEQVNNEYA
ncbi:Hypothetical predicted protein [Mytilus galloprovincialis]|uniref:Uncharacterized protein n=1 Tax=Mytilus galloprovincialis TaxID=29158 RepID=A0A8B6EVA1_MYTGA|nr:Hypothetical predicted protein [Mytilus galloprovincialis]